MMKPTKEEKQRCIFCNKVTKIFYRPDIDLKGLPICDPKKEGKERCFMTLMVAMNEGNIEKYLYKPKKK